MIVRDSKRRPDGWHTRSAGPKLEIVCDWLGLREQIDTVEVGNVLASAQLNVSSGLPWHAAKARPRLNTKKEHHQVEKIPQVVKLKSRTMPHVSGGACLHARTTLGPP